MIDYEEDWIFWLIFRREGSVAWRVSLFALPASLIAVLILFLDDWSQEFEQNSGYRDIIGSQTWSASVGALAILLSFRTSSALKRFWEGTGLLHQMRGEWFDSVSCCVTFSRNATETKPKEVSDFRHTLVRLMSLCHASALEEIADSDEDHLETIDMAGIDLSTLRHLIECKRVHDFNRVEVLLHMSQTLITKAHADDVLAIPPPILSRVYQTLSRGFVNLLNAKKITDTRFPFPYAQVISILLFLQVFLMPIMMSALIRNKWFAAILTFIPIFGMFSLNFIASELENPFGNDDNDLPLEHFQCEMNTSLLMLLHHNTDHVALLSDRCQLDFSKLVWSMKPTRDSVDDRRSKLPDRLSMFVESESEDHVPVSSGSFSRGVGEPSVVAVASRKSAQSLNSVFLGPSSTPASVALVAPKEDPVKRSLDEFNVSITQWTKTMEGQADGLNRTFDSLKQLNDAIPRLVTTLQARRAVGAGSQWRNMQERTVLSLASFPAL